MQPQDPNPLDYRTPGREPIRQRSRGAGKRFFIGLVAGSGASFVYWPMIWRIGDGAIILALVVPFVLVKIIAAVSFLGSADRREIGVGLLVSFAIGFMIFFGTCASNFKV